MRAELDDYDAKTWKRMRSKIQCDQESGCWVYTGAGNGIGYAQVWYRGKNHYAHRIAYQLFVGEIPDGLELDHVKESGCRYRSCINPKHLEAVTRQENMHRAAVGIHNAIKTHCPKGHEYTPENTQVYRGMRRCRACDRERNRKRRENACT
ncbi:HNH endonuclease signature motif containing protein [Streptomyces graminis]|uniref:HNH endonuclease signature motif containing protein n=1 Tax=Streptomyces graminis TaxID=1464081 RepID=UPI000997FA50